MRHDQLNDFVLGAILHPDSRDAAEPINQNRRHCNVMRNQPGASLLGSDCLVLQWMILQLCIGSRDATQIRSCS